MEGQTFEERLKACEAALSDLVAGAEVQQPAGHEINPGVVDQVETDRHIEALKTQITELKAKIEMRGSPNPSPP